MIYDFIEKFKVFFIDKLKGSDKRSALALLSKELGKGGQRIVANEFGVSRNTIRKGKKELESGFRIVDAFNARGRDRVEEKLPYLMDDIKGIVDAQSQTDPNFKTTRLFTRLTVKEVREQLIKQKWYRDDALPTNATLATKINELGYSLKKVRKLKPLKKIAETDDIFENLKKVHEENKGKENIVRISIDTKDRVKIGNFSRGGYSRTLVQACDHDFSNKSLVPFGILDLNTDEIEFIFTEGKVTADFMVDAIEAFWVKNRYNETKATLILNADNGPENHSRRRQFMKRMLEFSVKYNLKIILAYYPPYHSKYNPIERVWGRLEQHWNCSVLDSIDAVVGFANSMKWKGKTPSVILNQKKYEIGITVEETIMEIYESMIDRADKIGKWFVTINPFKCKEILDMEIKT